MLLLSAILVVAMASACSGSQSATSSPSTPNPTVASTPTAAPTPSPPPVTPSPPAELTLSTGSLEPGRYGTTAFGPHLSFTLAEGWDGFFNDADGLGLAHGSHNELFMVPVRKVIDPVSGGQVDVPTDLANWLAEHPGLDADPPQPAEVAGLPAMIVDADMIGNTERGLFAYPTGNMRLVPGTRVRYYVVPLDGLVMTIVVLGSPDTFADYLPLVEPVLESLEIESGP